MCRWKGQGLAASSQEQTVPEVHLDYCSIREVAGEDHSVVLVGKDRETKLILAHVVPFKGGDTEWVSEQVCRDLLKFGISGDVVFKTDQEPALVDLIKQICALRPSSRSCLTHSGVGDSKRNGLAERAVQSLEEMIRVHKLSFESRLKTKLPCAHPLMAWLVEHCADVLNRYNIGVDGRTPYQRLKGTKFVGAHAGVRDFCDVSRLWKGAWRGHAGEVVPWDLAGQEAALGGTPGDEGRRVGGEVESSKRKQPTPCHGGL